jgi:hypothetical protein
MEILGLFLVFSVLALLAALVAMPVLALFKAASLKGRLETLEAVNAQLVRRVAELERGDGRAAASGVRRRPGLRRRTGVRRRLGATPSRGCRWRPPPRRV